jgi:predicted O-methyltransferase YrrM
VAIAAALRDEECGTIQTLDPFQKQFGNIGAMELERLGLSKYSVFCSAYAEEYLLNARAENATYDMIFHDGARSIGPKMTHVFLASELLAPSGIFALHDAFKSCTVACQAYLVTE